MTRAGERKKRPILNGPFAPFLTHLGLAGLTAALFAMMFSFPIWVSAFPCTLLHCRIGVLIHEYIHGIPFARYRHNGWVVGMFDGVLMTFGLLELFRGTHLAHHRWLNTDKDGGFQSSLGHRNASSFWNVLSSLEGFQHARYLYQALRGGHAYVRSPRIATGFALSLASIALWTVLGHSWVMLYLVALNLYNALVTASLRGAVEHHSYVGDDASANEYEVWLPLFNLNRHVHHHLDPTCPWYLLEFRTVRPLPAICYLTHWYHVYMKRDYALMPPPR